MAIPPLDAAASVAEPEITPLILSPADDRDPAIAAGLLERMLFLSDQDGTMRAYTAETHAPARSIAEMDQPGAHTATLPGAHYDILVSAERGGTVGIYRVGLFGYVALAPLARL